MTVFDQRKTKILQELTSDSPDLSPQGSPDDGVLALLQRPNAHIDYITTSSCSGRAVVFLDADKDGQGDNARGRWLMNRHTPFTQDELSKKSSLEQLHALLFGDLPIAPSPDLPVIPSRMVSFKFEPLILHVLCRDMTAAARLLRAATATGYRESGMSISGYATPQEKIMVAIRTTSLHLDIPLASYDSVNSTVVLLGLTATYLGNLLNLANIKFKENEQRKEFLIAALQSLQEQPVEQVRETKEARRIRKREEGLSLQASSSKGITGNDSTDQRIRDGKPLLNDDEKYSLD